MDLLWHAMPADIHAHIIMQLDFPTFIVAHLVCQRWRIITQENEECILNKFVQTEITKDEISIKHIDYLPNLRGIYTIRHNYTRKWWIYGKSFQIEIWNKGKICAGHYEDHIALNELSARNTIVYWYILNNGVLDINEYGTFTSWAYYFGHNNIFILNFRKTSRNIEFGLTNFSAHITF